MRRILTYEEIAEANPDSDHPLGNIGFTNLQCSDNFKELFGEEGMVVNEENLYLWFKSSFGSWWMLEDVITDADARKEYMRRIHEEGMIHASGWMSHNDVFLRNIARLFERSYNTGYSKSSSLVNKIVAQAKR